MLWERIEDEIALVGLFLVSHIPLNILKSIPYHWKEIDKYHQNQKALHHHIH